MSRAEKIIQMLQTEPDDVFLNFGLAMEYVKAGQQDKALVQFDRVLALDATYTAAHYHKGNTLIGLGRTDEARQILTSGVTAAQGNGDAHAEGELQVLLDSIA